MRTLIVDQHGRGHSTADTLTKNSECQLFSVATFEHPGLVDASRRSGGRFEFVDSLADPKTIAEIALRHEIELLIVNNDDALAAGVVDAALEALPNLKSASPTKEGSRGEWEKSETRKAVKKIEQKLGVQLNPEYELVSKSEKNALNKLREVVNDFKIMGIPIAVKPQNLAGGRGVKVQGEHFDTFEQGLAYAEQVLRMPNQTAVLIEQNLFALAEGDKRCFEYNLQCITDGKTVIIPPVTYDFPFLFDGDTGPGTGGTGCFTMAKGKMPFLSEEDYDLSVEVSKELVRTLNEGKDPKDWLKGTAYVSFIWTPKGIRVIELNARGGCPEHEAIDELKTDDTDEMTLQLEIASGELTTDSVKFKRMAAVVVYFYPEEYCQPDKPTNKHEFIVNPAAMRDSDVRIRFGSAERTQRVDHYRTVGISRSMALVSSAGTPWEARANIDEGVRRGLIGDLVCRNNIGSQSYIRKMRRR